MPDHSRPGEWMREQLRDALHQVPSASTTYGPPWALAAWLLAAVVLVLPAALLFRRGFDLNKVGALALLGLLVLPCSIAFVFVGVARWRKRWRLDAVGFAGEGYTFQWDAVEHVEVHLTPPEDTSDLDRWLDVTVRLRNGDVCGLEPDGFERTLALMGCVPQDRRQVR